MIKDCKVAIVSLVSIMKIGRLSVVLLLLGVGIITSGNAFAMTDEEIIKTAESYLATPASREQQETDMREYVKFRSVAAGASYTAESRAAADWLRNWLETRLDMKDAALYESGKYLQMFEIRS